MIGNNSYIGEGCTLEKSLVLGNDYYTNEKTRAASIEKGESALGIGRFFASHSAACVPTDTAVCTQPRGYKEKVYMSHSYGNSIRFSPQYYLAV